MRSYRLYFLTKEGRVCYALEFACETDEDALRRVEQHRDGRAMELWNLDRTVATFPAERLGMAG